MKKQKRDQLVQGADGEDHLRPDRELISILIKVRPDLYRAFQRCTWILIHESGRTQLDVMEEMVEDFLIKHQC
ncbi:MAG: hypothetical protein ACOY4H_02575 [Thermodesulfobacteriota bacterium]